MTKHSTNPSSSTENNKEWTVYILVSNNGSRTYVGICLDMTKRLLQHNGEIVGGAKSTRAGRPWLVHLEIGCIGSRSEAQVLEAQIKALGRQDRLDYALY